MQYRPRWLQSSAPDSKTITFLYCFAGVYIFAILILSNVSWRDPTSIFFRPRRAYEKQYSDVRGRQSEAFLAKLNLTGSSNSSRIAPEHPSTPELCVGMPSVSRHGARYLRTAFASVLEGLTEAERNRIYLIIFLADLDPTRHPIYNETHITGLADRLLTYNVSDTEELKHIKGLDDNHKGVYDYRLLLNACMATGAPYVALLEDDVLAMEGWFERTMEGLNRVKENKSDWVYLRLFYTEIYLGWNSEHMGGRVFWSLVLIGGTAYGLLTIRKRSSRLKGVVTLPLMLAVCCIAIPLSIILFFLTGRLTLFPLPHGVRRMNEYGCCSQGLLFNGEHTPAMVKWLGDTPSGLYFDMFVEKYAEDFHLDRWAIMPPVLQHIGVKSSSAGEKSEWAARIWNFEFETYDAQQIARERGRDPNHLG